MSARPDTLSMTLEERFVYAESVLPAPAEVRNHFDELAAVDPRKATEYLYQLGVDSSYVQVEAIARNIQWTTPTRYGVMEITINLSKPEKDPKAIAAALAQPKETEDPKLKPVQDDEELSQEIPLCDLCWSNEQFPGCPGHPPKPGLRVVAITLGGERWGLQFSPYAYFYQHCIALSESHRPMHVDPKAIGCLLDFVDLFPFYFIGSNADLPIVGGSILSHDHFQGGLHTFPLMKATIEEPFTINDFPEVEAGIVDWPSSVIRLASADRASLEAAADRVWERWRTFSDEECGIFAVTTEPHNTLNPIVHKAGGTAEGRYIIDLVLRNNRTDDEHPFGIFHPPVPYHHIKKENIGLIEIMGLAILPPRLVRELPAMERLIAQAVNESWSEDQLHEALQADPDAAPHADWGIEIFQRHGQALATWVTNNSSDNSSECLSPVVREEIGLLFAEILEATGVFKTDEAGRAGFRRFIAALNE